MANKNLKNPLDEPPSASLSDGEEELEIISSGVEEDVMYHQEDESEDQQPVIFKRKEVCGSGEAQPSTRVVKSGTKRPSEGTSRNVNTKRAKSVSKRLFSEKDELVLLQGIIDSIADKDKSLFEVDKQGFYESMKNSISRVTCDQFMYKMRNMKNKYRRIEKSGEQASFLNAHERKCFELSKEIWGAEGRSVEVDGKNGDMEVISSEEEEEEGEEDHQHTIFSTEEDEPEDPPPRRSVEEVYGSGEARAKRLSEGTSTNVILKRAKKLSTEGDEKIGANATFFRKLFSEKDDILLLQGLIKFKADKEKNPFEDKLGLYEFMKDSLSFHATLDQFRDKIGNMQKKYARKEKRGEQASFLNSHQKKCFQLSKAIWGAEGMAVESAISSNGAPKESETVTKKLDLVSSRNDKNVEDDGKNGDMEESPLGVTEPDWFENSFLVQSIENLGLNTVKEVWSKVPIETKKKTEEKMKLLQANELECKKIEETLKAKKDQCLQQRIDMLREVTFLIMEAN